ncbi:MAG: Plug domain-containing protein, partial [Prevotella sp.]|nr:Plug domain-containing protein [Prevotella sp.]
MTAREILIVTLGIVSAGAAYAQNKVVTHRQTTVITKEDTLAAVSVKGVVRPNDVTSTAPLYTVTAADMARLGITDISDALHRLPGVTLRDYGGAGGMKTVSVRGFGAQHTAVVYDGVVLSDCQSGQIDVSRYTLNDMGGLSLVVGDNDDIFIPAKNAAAAATLHISTAKMPSDDSATHLTAQMRLGAWGYTNPFLKIEKNLSDRLGLSFVGDYIYAENDYPYTIKNVTQDVKDRRNNSRMNSCRAELNMVYRTSGAGLLSLKAYYYDNSRQLPGMVHYYVNES